MNHNHLKLLPLALLLALCVPANAQQHDWDEYIGALTADDDNDIEISGDMAETLDELADNPIDINHATREDLARIPFLTDQQIEDIEAYIYQYHGMRTAGELALIESLDYKRRQLLQHFVRFDNGRAEKRFPRLDDILKGGKHTLTATANIPLYDRKGDRNGYLGPKYRHYARYEFTFGNYVKAGLQGSQDAGEPFFAEKNSMGYDHYTYYIVLRQLGRIKALALGQYRLRMGMGLVMNTGTGFGKLMTLSSLGRSTNSISANTSRSQGNTYLQGAAATVALTKRLDLTGFFSYRGIDATLNKDGTIATILGTGYHRTPGEMEKKNNTHLLATGGKLHWEWQGLHTGVTGVYTRSDRELKPKTSQIYRRHYPAGTSFWNASVDYGYRNHWLTLNGETATGNSHGIATINSASAEIGSTLSVVALQRFYSFKYSAIYAQSFSDGGRVQNESGLYVGVNWQALPKLDVTFYTDYAYFAWPRYQASQSSHSWDNMLKMTYATGAWTILGSYRLKTRQKDNSGKNALTDDRTDRGRLSAAYNVGKWSVKLQGDIAHNSYTANSLGWMATATAALNIWKCSIAATAGYFDTDDYASRIYTYERGPRYSFYFPAYYGEGIHYAIFARADPSKHLMVIAQCGVTDYFDRDHISSGLQQIDRSSQSDLQMQVVWKF